MTLEFTQDNDQIKGWRGTEIEVPLPADAQASEDLAYLDAVEFHSSTDKRIRKATGADDSQYLGIVADSGGIDSGDIGRIIKGVEIPMTMSGTGSQGDLVEATNNTTVAALELASGPYALAKNTFGRLMQAGVNAATVLVLVEPQILNN